jgi:PAS domain S-box-containing protein
VTSLAEQRLVLALEAAELGTWTWDMASATTVWDARLEALHGLPPGGFGGTFDDWVAALYPDDRAECLRRVERALADPGPYVLLHRCIWPDGSMHWIECRGRVTVDADGAPTGTIGVAIDVTARERQAAAVVQELEEEHDLVERLQQALLPTALPSIPAVTLATRYVATAGPTVVGGDWYAAVPLPDGRLGLAIGDVTGHGLPAVADMADARFSLRALALGEEHPEDVLTRLNRVVQLFEDDTVITALYGMIDPVRQTWSYASGGHPPPVLRLADGTTTLLPTAGQPPLGLAVEYRRFETSLPAGATIVLYTDGLVERRGESIETGLQRLVAACRNGSSEPEELCDELLGLLLDQHANHDDAALLVATLAASS